MGLASEDAPLRPVRLATLLRFRHVRLCCGCWFAGVEAWDCLCCWLSSPAA